jgi:hypothetical protein
VKQKIVAFTVAIGEEARRDAEVCEKTFKHFHPDIPFFCFTEEHYKLVTGEEGPSWVDEVISLRAPIGWLLSKHFERVVYFDSDCYSLARLEDLVDAKALVLLTADYSGYTMRAEELPILNCGVMSVANEDFWKMWTLAQYGYLLPATPKFFFDQLSLRLLANSGSLQYEVLNEFQLKRFYNVKLHEAGGEYRLEEDALYKGDCQVMLYHVAGRKVGEGVAEEAKVLIERVLEKTEVVYKEGVRFEEIWGDGGEGMLKELFEEMGLGVLDKLMADYYKETEGYFRSSAPLAWDRWRNVKGSGFQRILSKNKPPFYIYTQTSEK